jgi:hypothetical protein
MTGNGIDFDPTREMTNVQKADAQRHDYIMRAQTGKIVEIGGSQPHPVYHSRGARS